MSGMMKSLSVVVMPTHMLPTRTAPMAPGTMTAYFDQIEEVRAIFSDRQTGREAMEPPSPLELARPSCHGLLLSLFDSFLFSGAFHATQSACW